MLRWLEGEHHRQAVEHEEPKGQTDDGEYQEVANLKPDKTSPPADEEEIEGPHKQARLLLLDVHIDNLLRWRHVDVDNVL